MEKVVRLINILDNKIVDKLVMLDRLVHLYAKFTTTWRNAEVKCDGMTVKVKWLRINKYGYESFTERVFPTNDLDKRITSYKYKIKKEFNNRHENPRLQKETEERKLKNNKNANV